MEINWGKNKKKREKNKKNIRNLLQIAKLLFEISNCKQADFFRTSFGESNSSNEIKKFDK